MGMAGIAHKCDLSRLGQGDLLDTVDLNLT